MSTPFEGYKQVEAFGPDEDYDEEATEEFYVTLDLGQIDQTLIPSSSTYRLIGLDTPTPFLQLSGVVFKGHHQTLLGTELVFTDPTADKETNGDEPSGTSRKRNDVEFFASTERRIRFKEVQLKPKQTGTEVSSDASTNTRKKSDFVFNFGPHDEPDETTNARAGPSRLRRGESVDGPGAPAGTSQPIAAPASVSVSEPTEFQIDPLLLSLSAEALADGSAFQMHPDAGPPGQSVQPLFTQMMAANDSGEGSDFQIDGMEVFQGISTRTEEDNVGVRASGSGRGRGRGGAGRGQNGRNSKDSAKERQDDKMDVDE